MGERARTRPGARGALSLALLSLALLGACGGEAPEKRADTIAAPEARTYQVRGVVRDVPDLQGVPDQVLIHHEPIPDFVDVTGRPVGMKSMTMPFFPAPDVDLAGLARGDKISFRLVVDWTRIPPATISEIEELPPETELAF